MKDKKIIECDICKKKMDISNWVGSICFEINHRIDDGNNIHDTEKPVELMAILIENSSNPNNLVLDPFMGSGTTAIACKQLNRNFIGFEINKEYCDMANKRLEQSNIKEFV